MNTHLSARLNRHLDALVPAAETLADAAQRRLEARLAAAAHRSAPRWIGWTTAAAAACLVLAMTLLPTSRGIAFDVVRGHLRDFRTLTLVVEQRSQGMALPGIRVRMNREGDVRTDVGDATSTIVSPRRHAMLTLLHQTQQALPLSLPPGVVAPSDADRFAWLDAIRDFQGQAKPLPGTRRIDGRATTGWAIDTQGMHIELWADADGLPRAVEINGGQMLSQRMHVTLDAPIDPAVFSLQPPPGYQAMGDDERE